MLIVKTTCPLDIKGNIDSAACHKILLSTNPTVMRIKHNPNNHILLFALDYDLNGNHSQDIHDLASFLDSGLTIQAKAKAQKLGIILN